MTTTIADANVATQAEIRALIQTGSRITVYQDGVNVIAVRASDGTIISTNTDPGTVINAAMAALTSGRTWKEAVSVIGDFTVDGAVDSIEMPSFTILNLHGKLTIATNQVSGAAAINATGASAVAPVTDIEINGGYINGGYSVDAAGAETGQSSNQPAGIKLLFVERFKINGVDISNTKAHNIAVTSSLHASVINCTLKKSGDDSISMLGSTHINITSNDISDNYGSVGGSSGIEIEDGSGLCTISNNIIYSMNPAADYSGDGGNGIQCVIDPAGSGDITKVTIVGNVCDGVELNGIAVQNNRVGGLNSSVVVVGNSVSDGGANGLAFTTVGSATFNGNTVIDVLGVGINLNKCEDSSVVGNVVKNTGEIGISAFAGKNVAVIGNQILNTGTVAAKFSIQMNTTDGCTVIGNNVDDDSGATGTRGIKLISALGPNTIADNHLQNLQNADAIALVTSTAVIRGNTGTDEDTKSGTATIVNGTTSIAFNHGIGVMGPTWTVDQVSVNPLSNLGSAAKFWVSAISATQITISVDADPGADIDFAWQMRCDYY